MRILLFFIFISTFSISVDELSEIEIENLKKLIPLISKKQCCSSKKD